PFNATTGIDNNGDGVLNDRPVIDGTVVTRYGFRGTALYDTAFYAEVRLPLQQSRALTFRIEGFNVFNHANMLGRLGTYGDTGTPNSTFGAPNAGLANLDPGRMFQLQARFNF